MPEPYTFVLVHSPLVGPLTWQSCAEVLTERGHRVVVPSLTEVLEAPQSSYRRAFAERVIEAVGEVRSDETLVLVPHSGAGILLPTMVEAFRVGVSAAIFVDAQIPHEGESLFGSLPAHLEEQIRGLARGAWMPPWNRWFPEELEAGLPEPGLRARFVAELRQIPVAYLEESASIGPSWDSVPCGFLRLNADYDGVATEAEQRGWPTIRLEADHLAMLTRPVEIADAVEQLVAVVTGRRGHAD